ncbi:hypothetical protein LK13_09355 [Paenibacillus polymyxa]|uniref:TnsD family Tn7-like transposition protein n=1 Tax=Paenibacillus polymyxa TaxID=1406 RepID=UPI00057CFD7C|nr:TnsD family Tn7-like transposition protein [Paenibacillus polymyxa]AIY08777.1 hypothetical protein LK13_09355 [Paenibacillus polymyxa]
MGKIIYFPPTYPDEDFRSIVHRYYLRSTKTYALSKIELLGNSVPDRILYPQNLARMSLDLGVTEDFVDHIIENHSFFPIIRPFLTKDKQADTQEGMRVNSSRNQLNSRSLHSFISTEGRYCPDCMIEDYNQYRVVYLHRLHQFSFLSQCLIHGCDLISRCNTCGESLIKKNGKEMLHDLCCPFCNQDVIENRVLNKRQVDEALVNDINTLMNEKGLDIESIHLKLMICIGARGFIHFRGDFIYKKKLMLEFIEFYGERYLLELGIFTKELLSVQNITRLFDKRYMGRFIIVYILMMRFLSGSVKSFLNSQESYSIKIPFGVGPWPCLNPICTHYNELVITNIRRKAHEWVTGRFTCSHCGLIYTRKAKPNEDENSGYSIETWGFLFIQKVIEYFEMGMTLDQIGEKLYSNRTTVRKYLRPYRGQRRKHKYARGIEEEKVLEIGFFEAAVVAEDKITTCKETILEAIKTLGNDATRPQIRKYNMHRYDWLMKREREWMEQHLPPRKLMSTAINWETKDDEMYQDLKRAITKVYSENPRERISGLVIFKELSKAKHQLYYTNRSILPRSRELLESKIETEDAYALRTVSRVIEWFKQSRYKNLSLKLVQNRFTIYKKCSKEVQEWIIKEIERQTR